MSEGCGCEGCHEHEHENEHEHGEQSGKIKLVRIIISLVLLVAVWLISEKTKLLDGMPLIVFYAVPYLVAGYDVLSGAVRNIIKGKVFDENFLMAVASLGAFAIGEYTEAVAVMIFNQVGGMFEDYAVDKSHRSIAKLMDIVPEHAFVLRGGETVQVSPKEVEIGETIVVRAGERVPLDGVVTDGDSSVDTSALTGESQPRTVQAGDEVLSGCVNLTGLIKVKVTKGYENSTVAKIMELVEHTSEKKTRAENFITKFARRYTPTVVVAAVLLFAVPSIITGDWQNWLRRALVFLVVSCPCALVVSVPLSFFSGIGAASRKGILIKGSNYIDALSKVKTVVFDKTGTLTKGEFSVTRIVPNGISEEQLLGFAALCESGSTHPVAKSIVKAYAKPTDTSVIESLQEVAGKGVVATVKGKTISVGNEKLMQQAGAEFVSLSAEGTAVYVAVGSEYAGCIVVSDGIKDGSAKAISQLKKLGVEKTVMLTGDNEHTARGVADKLGIDEFHARLLPGDKVERVEALLEHGGLAFVGDGINDAPVLARADIGFAMGAGGSDAAIEAADVVLMDDMPEKVALAVRIARRTMSIVRQNIVFALGVKVLVMLLGAIGVVGMWAAVFADVGVLVLAVLNAMRGLRVPKE